MRKRSQEEILHCRLLFTAGGIPGIIQGIVDREIKTSKDNIGKESVLCFFACRGLHGIVAFIETIDSRNLVEFGSATICFSEITTDETDEYLSQGKVDPFQSIRIGSVRNSISPLEWFTALTKGFDEGLSRMQKEAFDEVCHDINLALQTPSVSLKKGWDFD